MRLVMKLWFSSRGGTLFRAKKILLVLIYAWLFMNLDPGYNHRVVKAMMMSRARSRNHWFNPSGGGRDNITPGNSLSTIETIALIQAINGNRGGSLPLDLNTSLNSPLSRQLDISARQQLEYNLERQLGPPMPRVAAVAAVAAFLAAVAAGVAPIVAVAAAAAAAAAALLAIVISLMKMKNKSDGKGKGKGKALIKKLVIKKTVLPFVIPIVIKNKKEEEKIYKIVKKPEHSHESKGHYKYKKVDKIKEKEKEHLDPSMKQIEYLLNEQNRLQSMVDKIIEVTESDKTSIMNKNTENTNRVALDRRMGNRGYATRRKGSTWTTGQRL